MVAARTSALGGDGTFSGRQRHDNLFASRRGGSGGGIGSGVGPYVMGSGVKEPVVLRQPLPPYTEEARKMRAEGIVVLQAIVRKDGSVDSFKVIKGLGYGLDESAIRTIASKWRFQPGMYKGKPVDVVVDIEVAFSIY